MELELITKDFPAMLTSFGRAGLYSWKEIDGAIKEWQEEERYFEKLENYWQSTKKETGINEWVKEIEIEHGGYVKELKQRYLEQEVHKINEKISLAIDEGKRTDELWAKRDRALRRVYYHKYQDAGMSYTANEIEAARNISFIHFLEIKKDFALCSFHKEKTPSFFVKKNYGYCFGCHWKGDVIDYVMAKEHFNFPQAVKFLLNK